LMRLLVINGPNLNLLGTREPEIYGSTTLADLDTRVRTWASGLGVDVETEQSNSETRIIELIQTFPGDGIVLNPGAFTHTSRAIADAIVGVGTPVVEVHISNIRRREPWRAVSVVAEACARTIYGRGIVGYREAIRHLANRAAMPFETVRYGPHDDNVGDLRRGGDRLVVLVHGGFWRHEYERDTTESLALDLARRGHTTWNIEYRRLGGGGGWPGSGHDVLMALDAIPQLGLSPDRVTVVGHSAGAQLLMWAASRGAVEPSLHIALAPVLDLAAIAGSGEVGSSECRLLLDQGAPEVMRPDGVETVLVHGDGDQIVPVSQSVEISSRHELEHHRTDCDHFSLLDPTGPEWTWVVDRIAAGTGSPA
jgi:3-dehydroquinate dehydratase II